ncbi:MAG: toll/interleukin-1 receptor domain-containing protein, partial [Nitrosopumilus sp.]
MSKIFISYSHKDKQRVQNIVKKIKGAGHDIWTDESRLSISDAISSEIQKNIQNSDYVIVFLSSNSVDSKWVRQEIYEALYQELKNRELKLIPCLIDDCELPKA